jgi:hypothetical protein
VLDNFIWFSWKMYGLFYFYLQTFCDVLVDRIWRYINRRENPKSLWRYKRARVLYMTYNRQIWLTLEQYSIRKIDQLRFTYELCIANNSHFSNIYSRKCLNKWTIKMTVPGVYKPEKSDEAEVFLHSQMASQEHSDGNAPL